jgi:hypothetical protein
MQRNFIVLVYVCIRILACIWFTCGVMRETWRACGYQNVGEPMVSVARRNTVGYHMQHICTFIFYRHICEECWCFNRCISVFAFKFFVMYRGMWVFPIHLNFMYQKKLLGSCSNMRAINYTHIDLIYWSEQTYSVTDLVVQNVIIKPIYAETLEPSGTVHFISSTTLSITGNGDNINKSVHGYHIKKPVS